MPSWDNAQYGRYAGERARPFADLLARVDVRGPRLVVDLGCGTGALAAERTRRRPGHERDAAVGAPATG